MSKFCDNWTPKGAINSMIRRCRKHGVDDATIANLMILAVHELRAAQPGAPKAQSAVKTNTASRPKRKCTEKQLAALAKGRAKMQLGRDKRALDKLPEPDMEYVEANRKIAEQITRENLDKITSFDELDKLLHGMA